MEKRIGTVGFIVNNNKVLLAHIQYPEGKKLWNGIGGFVNKGEKLEDALIREISEETYIQVSKDEVRLVKELDEDIRLLIFKINNWKGELKIKDSSIKELRWFKFDEIPFSEMHDGNEKWLPDLLKTP